MSLTLAAAIVAQATLSERLDAILAEPKFEGGIVAVVVETVSGDRLYSHQSDLRVMPASNQKIVTAVFALETLGTSYRPVTKFWKVGSDIVIDSTGDPSLDSSEVAELRKKLAVKPGAIISVRQAYKPGHGPGWEADDLAFRYAAPISALCMDRGEFWLTAKDGCVGIPHWSLAKLATDPYAPEASSSMDWFTRTVTYNGKVPKDGPVARFAQPDPARSVALALGGTYRATDKVPDREPDLVFTGDDVATIAKNCLEPSDNVIAENLLLMAAGKIKPLGSDPYSEAAKQATAFYDRVGVRKGDLRIQDGSGLSRHNLVTATGLAQVLRHAYQQPYRDVFLEALPAAGEGTLGGRLAGIRVWAKTGTIDSVSALSGYLDVGRPEPVVFSIVMNHHVFSASTARETQDRLVKETLAALRAD